MSQLQSELSPQTLMTTGSDLSPVPSKLEVAAQELATQHLTMIERERSALRNVPANAAGFLEQLPLYATLLRQAQTILVTTTEEALAISYAAEWLLDNFYTIEQALRQVKEDLPAKYYHELPKLTGEDPPEEDINPDRAQFAVAPRVHVVAPRVHAVARLFLQRDEFQFDMERLTRFVMAYQQHAELTMGELWALPIMLRLILLENLARAAAHITKFDPQQLTTANGSVTAQKVAAFLQRNAGHTLDDQDLIANSIPSLRQIDTYDWSGFFERVSLVHQQLCADPVAVYQVMDFATRNRYRGAIEALALGTGQSELAVAQRVIDLATAAYRAAVPAPANVPPADTVATYQPLAPSELDTNGRTADIAAVATNDGQLNPGQRSAAYDQLNLHLPRACHVGYYLLAEGRPMLERELGYQGRGQEARERALVEHPTFAYLSAIGLVTAMILILVALYLGNVQSTLLTTLLALLLTLMPALTVAVNLVNWIVTHLLPPRTLPKLDFSEGIPANCRTIVVIPSLIANISDVDNLLSELEQHYLRNTDPALSFAVLSDFADAPAAQMPEDESLLARARERMMALNEQYSHHPFYFFHRHRLFNASENTWMGWERKRGKLHEFNALLRGATETSYDVQLGDLTQLPTIRYVITLDADTVLPRDGAERLIGALAHPLNRAHFDPATGRVTAGYTVLQPRAEIKPTSTNRSLFTRVFAGDTGIDLYSLAVSDVYQDLFGAGIYVGKGIYDVDAFERSLVGRVPENTLLSHDLFEGMHGRVGLVTDIVLYEDYPPHYLVNVLRSHRWVRGDWQLLPWLAPWTPRVDQNNGKTIYRRNDLPLIDRWKIADNLRRSLLSPALLLLFLAGWTILPGASWFWTLLGLLTPAFSLIAGGVTGFIAIFTSTRGKVWQRFFHPLRNNALRWLLFLAFLPYESLLTLDAVGRTLVRLLIRRRKMLEWTTAARAVRLFGRNVTVEATLVRMLPSIIVVALLALVVNLTNPPALLLSAPFFLVWLLAAEIAYWISRPISSDVPSPTVEQRRQLRTYARRTWLFYEQFVGPDDNWLPPDHFQESPRGVVAHRTSPTNVGLYLLAMLSAYDLGYISVADLAFRLRFTFETMDRLDRYRGHFLNWIDTSSLAPLPPSYVSTVDSGNLAGCLIALKQGCLALPEQRIWRWQWWEGLLDTIRLLAERVDAAQRTNVFPAGGERALRGEGDTAVYPAATRPAAHSQVALSHYLHGLEEQVAKARERPEQWYTLLNLFVNERLQELDQLLAQSAADMDTEVLRDCRIYSERIHQHLRNMQREVAQMLPWLTLLATPPAVFTTAEDDSALQRAWQGLLAVLPSTARWQEIEQLCHLSQAKLASLKDELANEQVAGAEHHWSANELAVAQQWCNHLGAQLNAAARASAALLENLQQLAQRADTFVQEMDFSFLYHRQRQVFHIGYNIDVGRLDNSYYDLLASEARIASLLAIAKQDVPQSHWLHLARPLTQVAGGEQTLLSWSGTMFEYLMPPLLLHTYPDTLLFQSCLAVIDQQIAYGRQKGVPWGISESGFYTFDAAMNYQYRAFGAPGLGFKRGLSDDLVIAPYASLLALPFRPREVMQNIEQLKRLNAVGRYGFYEAIDFTPSHLNLGQENAIVRSYMAHHQGMIMLALADYLQGKRMVERFHAEPMIESVEILLQEQIPKGAPLQFPHEDEQGALPLPQVPVAAFPWRVPVDSPMPLVHYLSNGQYGTLVTNAGSGYSANSDLAFTRWRADTTRDHWGSWLYLQDLESGAYWSAGRQPTGARGEFEEVTFHPHMAEFRRRDHGIFLQMEIFVGADDNVEFRRIALTNEGDEARRIGLTGYSEVALAPSAADRRHQAFAKLFVESEYLSELGLLLFRRRPRAATESPSYLAHMLIARPLSITTAAVPNPWLRTRYESDRARFLGRGHNAAWPEALADQRWWREEWQGVTGATLDPIMALGQEISLAPHATVQLVLVTLNAPTREGIIALARRFRVWTAIDRSLQRTRSQAERELRQLGLRGNMLEQIQQLLSLLIYPHGSRRADAATLAANTRGQSALWAYGISGDYPVLLLRMASEGDGETLQELLQAHTYWRRRGLRIDLVILNEQDTNYGQPLQNYIYRLAHRLDSDTWINQRGGIFILRADQMSNAERILLYATARVLLRGNEGTLAQQLAGLYQQPLPLPAFEGANESIALESNARLTRPTDLQFDNGYGGFSADGREYVIYLEPGAQTPAPWINVVANADFGFLASESGGGYTWALNSGENRLTTWRNDPISDEPAEALYLRDEETAQLWSPTPQPAGADAPYLIRHGAGYTSYEHQSHDLAQMLRLFVAPTEPVKILQLQLRNLRDRPRRITVTYYAEWVLGVDRDSAQQFVVPEYDQRGQALLARNAYHSEFGERVAFMAANKAPHGLTTDRSEFIGRLGNLQRPDALTRVGLSGQIGAGVDPCAVLQLHIDLPPYGEETLYFLLGQGADRQEALTLIERYQQADVVEQTWAAVAKQWDDILGTVTVETPDAAMNLLLNRWLLYQALACRTWGRSALYQSSGAYGFRDQLQDVMALVYTRPDLTRAHIVRSAHYQFEAGDVLHWWHPPSGRGVRTRMTDDLAWLPYVTAHYIAATGDRTVLEEKVPFLQGAPLADGEEERYAEYEATAEHFTIYEHCRRALKRAITAGEHGIPLMGAGDWNDGMSRVGIDGKGESIWLGWFLHATATNFALLCEQIGEHDDATRYRAQAEAIRQAVEKEGWDGAWYRRAYYDDGTPLGSAQNEECQIDAIAQSWAVLSGAGDPQRARRAMAAVDERLIREEDRLLLLFTPPFDKTQHDPGYIKGYLPGIRENGGQYTHAALWTIWAFAELGDGDRAEALFRLINPIYRADSQAKADHYKVEPYVIAADVYGVAPHTGRGGWTWYTGSSGWMYRLGVEAMLGLRRSADTFWLEPRIPKDWNSYRLTYRVGTTTYQLQIEQTNTLPHGEQQVSVDGVPQADHKIRRLDDGNEHNVLIRLGSGQ